MATPEEAAALNEVMQLLEAEPVDTTSVSTSLVSVTNDENIPAQRKKLAVLVSTGKSKEAIGVQLTHDQVINAFPTRMFKNAPKGMKPTSATRQPSL